MILTFTQSSDQSFGGVPAYEAEFEVTSNFAIHIERTRGDAALILKQRTGGGKYALVDDFNYAKSKGEVLDYEASVTIPKYIKIVSEVEPTLAEIVTDGEVTEIKAQAKVVEVTTNGTTEVVPDSGFAYLSKVNVKTNVPTSGGGEGDGGFAYYAITMPNLKNLGILPTLGVILANCTSPSQTIITYSGVASDEIGGDFTLNAICVLIGKPFMVTNTQSVQFKSEEEADRNFTSIGFTKITEEEFYNLNA